jgi:site-specific recombinase XerD
MILRAYMFHLRARNLSPATVKATEEYLRPFIACHDPLTVTRRDIETYLADMSERCKPSSVWTAWRHLKGFFTWLHSEGDISVNPMIGVTKPIVPPSEITVLAPQQVRALLATCKGTDPEARRDHALLAIMLDTGLRLSEVARLTIDDINEEGTLRVFGKGRKWRTVALGTTSATALNRWIRLRTSTSHSLWSGRKGALSTEGIRKVVERRGRQAGFRLHAHMLRHTFVDNWLRNGGAEVDLARLAGWTSTRMAERYAQHRADERAVTAHKSVAPLDRLQTHKTSKSNVA